MPLARTALFEYSRPDIFVWAQNPYRYFQFAFDKFGFKFVLITPFLGLSILFNYFGMIYVGRAFGVVLSWGRVTHLNLNGGSLFKTNWHLGKGFLRVGGVREF
jgi:hypothetical protein